jgi:hypothetical protein
MINHTTYRIDSTTNNKLNPRFSFIGFTSFDIGASSLSKSVFGNLFSIKKLQIQFYNLQGKNIQSQQQSQDEQENEGKNPFSVQFVENFVRGFDTVLFTKDFKIYI